jgi:hypothetical protein
MLETKHFLVNMLVPSIKQKLYMKPNMTKRSMNWKEIDNRKTYILNGQHNVATNKAMRISSLIKDVVKHFRE